MSTVDGQHIFKRRESKASQDVRSLLTEYDICRKEAWGLYLRQERSLDACRDFLDRHHYRKYPQTL